MNGLRLRKTRVELKVEELDGKSDDELPVLPGSGTLPVVICGPSGSGKTTLLRRLLEEFPGNFSLAVSHTTRPPRIGEEDGVDYRFVSQEEFERVDFLERSIFAGNSYGTSKRALDVPGTIVLDLNLEGVLSVKSSGISARYLLVVAPSRDELEKRLEGRGTARDSLSRRLREADDLENECERAVWDAVLINDDLEKAYVEFERFMFR